MAVISAAEKLVCAAKRLAICFRVWGLQFTFVDQTKIAFLHPGVINDLKPFKISGRDLGEAGEQLQFALFSITA